MYYVYVLLSQKDRNFYVGYTHNLKERLKRHNNGEVRSTSYRTPFKLIYYEAYLLKQDAEAREKYLKTSMGKRVLKKQLVYFLQTIKTI